MFAIGADNQLVNGQGLGSAGYLKSTPGSFERIPPKGEGADLKAGTPEAVVGGVNRAAGMAGLAEENEPVGKGKYLWAYPVGFEEGSNWGGGGVRVGYERIAEKMRRDARVWIGGGGR